MFKELGSNAKTWANDMGGTYISGPLKDKDPIKLALGVPMAAASVLFEAPDYLYAGAVDNKLSPPTGIMGRTRRDVSQLFDNVVHLRPLKTLTDGFRLISDVPMDGVDALAGFRDKTRSQVSYALAA